MKAVLAWAFHQELQQQQQQEEEAAWELRPELYVRLSEGKAADAAADTSDLLQLTAEPKSSSSSSDGWELHRRLLQQARLADCESRGSQTLLSTFYKDAETQETERKETATNTDVAAATVGPRSTRRFRGLRGTDAMGEKPINTVVLRFKF